MGVCTCDVVSRAPAPRPRVYDVPFTTRVAAQLWAKLLTAIDTVHHGQNEVRDRA